MVVVQVTVHKYGTGAGIGNVWFWYGYTYKYGPIEHIGAKLTIRGREKAICQVNQPPFRLPPFPPQLAPPLTIHLIIINNCLRPLPPIPATTSLSAPRSTTSTSTPTPWRWPSPPARHCAARPSRTSGKGPSDWSGACPRPCRLCVSRRR